ncbi:latent-transforming growth factor beta-binding protein 4-like [Neosynchiropus ocellatus]
MPLLLPGLLRVLLPLCACLLRAEGQGAGVRGTPPGCGVLCVPKAGPTDVPRSSSLPGQTQNQVPAQRVRGEHLGFKYCFREVKDGQCASPLLGLRTQEMCCRGIGQAWGTSDCILCPQSGQNSSCQSGFHQVNGTNCVDVNECLKPGLCDNGVCVNTRGSYSCVCRPGFILDASHGLCISRSVISEEKGQCYRVLSPGPEHSSCSLPILRNITRQICCCSRVGKAWGPNCQRCPYFGSDAFKQTCPAGPGYQYSASTLQFSQRSTQQLGSRGAPLVPPRDRHSQGSVSSRGSGLAVTPQGGSAGVSKMNPPLASSTQPTTLPPRTLRISGRTQPSGAPTQHHQNVPQSSPEWSARDTPKSPGLDSSRWNPLQQRRRAPNPTPQRRPAPSLAPKRGPGPDWPPTLPPRGHLRSVCENRPDACGPGHCVEQPHGGYLCECDEGYKPNSHMTFCHDRDECLQNPCGAAQCANTPGSFRCVCHHGYRLHNATCTDIDECRDPLRCPGQECLNSPGSYRCVSCQRGFQLTSRLCADVNECEDAGSCPGQECVNTEGSYRCVACRHGYRTVNGVCTDVDECLLSDSCFPRGECVNVPGSYACVCAGGFTPSADGSACLDVDECASAGGATCTSGSCVNTVGSYRCIASCPPGSRRSSSGECAGEVRECYYNLAEQGTCNLLATNTTQQECCCTVGEGWGLGCQYQTCPPSQSVQFQALCPSGRGYVTGFSEAFSYTDVDECKRFHPEVCKNGMCVNNIPGYKCYCSSGYVYDSTLLECVDHDECEEESCVGGACVNTVGSYYCSCPAPLALDDTQRTCVNASRLGLDESVSLCWRHTTDLVCQSPLLGGQVSFSDCCCLYGVGWGMECALCPAPDSGTRNARVDESERCPSCTSARRFARFDQTRTRCQSCRKKGRSYPDGDFGAPPPRPPSFYVPQDPRAERSFGALPPPPRITEDTEVRSPFYDRRTGTQRRVHERPHEALAGADCGILFGCENGRCIRVAEGYTCDCYAGYQLDLTFMTCTDINECDDIAGVDFPCVNARCVNTEGSFRCVCRRGHVMSHRPNHCVAA